MSNCAACGCDQVNGMAYQAALPAKSLVMPKQCTDEVGRGEQFFWGKFSFNILGQKTTHRVINLSSRP